MTFSFGQTTLGAGDIVITGFNSDNPDQFTFVLLTDVSNTTTINFTDNGWLSAGGFYTNEGVVTWTATTDLTCGTEITITDNAPFTATIGDVTDDNLFAFSATGDQILAYQGPDTAPIFIYAIDFNSTGWTDATSSNDTALPSGLTDAVDALNLPEIDNGIYNCTVINDPALILAATMNSANWTLAVDNPRFTLGGCSYSCCSTTTWDGTGWDNGNPNSSTAVIINGTYSSSVNPPGSFEACSLTVNALDVFAMSINLNVQGTDYISVVNDVTIDGTITIATEASLVQVNDASSVTLGASGDGILQKTTTYLDAWYDYTYWSSAFTNETIGSALMGVPAHRIYTYDAANYEDADNNGFDDNANDWIVAGQAEVMTPGKGYAAMADEFGMMPGNQTFTFNGQFNNGVISPPVTISPGPNPLNWNFLGNPYPSGIDADLFLSNPANSGLLGTIYLWTHNSPPDEANPGNEVINFDTDDYATYNSMGGTAAVSGGSAPTGIIASGQGFFIEATGSGVATFNNSMRVNLGNTDFFRPRNRVWLDFKNEFGAFSQILIGFDKNATNGVDRLYDGKRLDANNYVSFFSLIDDEKYAIQGREPINEEELIPLGVMSTIEGENEFTIGISNMEGVLEHSKIFLLDKYLNIEYDISQGDYTFSVSNEDVKDRFELRISTDIKFINESLLDKLLITDNRINQELNFSTTQLSNITNVKIFDMMGRLLYNVDYKNETKEASLKMSDSKNSIYIANVTLENGKVLAKKVIKQ